MRQLTVDALRTSASVGQITKVKDAVVRPRDAYALHGADGYGSIAGFVMVEFHRWLTVI